MHDTVVLRVDGDYEPGPQVGPADIAER
jgi:hypothetical protein